MLLRTGGDLFGFCVLRGVLVIHFKARRLVFGFFFGFLMMGGYDKRMTCDTPGLWVLGGMQ
ncbi:hypothetical protein EJ06DRAFT_331285 [Trichodelitschia bisporula]|uniref:Uncharacterized protein n=1 Tax=Trichodelitschia bisporula TaxID=703511 RepID=A0A6G1I248_9PEZI|nr:hypothetical protein EJ06DRAFT_331285 [Trichodelitschia bisporula]